MAKYTFETTTVGEMLDTPEIMELINKYIPAVLEHRCSRSAAASSSTTPCPT